MEEIDELDARLLLLLTDQPRLGVLECSRQLGVARGTVQARLDRLERRGILRGFPPDLDLAAMGYPLTGFVVLEIAQGRRLDVIAELTAIDEVCEAHSTTGRGDLLVRVVATSNADLQRVIERIVNVAWVERTSTSIALTTPIQSRTRPLLDRVATTRESPAQARESPRQARESPAQARESPRAEGPDTRQPPVGGSGGRLREGSSRRRGRP